MTDSIRITGHACVTNTDYSMGGFYTERVQAGAFRRTLGSDPDVFLLVNHAGLPLARTKSRNLRLSEDERGLRFEADIDPADPDVAALVGKMRRGDVDGTSFAFSVTDQEWNSDYTVRVIRAVNLHRGDVSICTAGANPEGSAVVDAERGALTLEERRERAERLDKRIVGFGSFEIDGVPVGARPAPPSVAAPAPVVIRDAAIPDRVAEARILEMRARENARTKTSPTPKEHPMPPTPTATKPVPAAPTRATSTTPDVRVTGETLTYDPRAHPARSFFADHWQARKGGTAAVARLARHAQEMDVELRAREQREQRKAGDRLDVTFEYRVNPNRTPGQGGSFAPPLWLIDQFASVPRPERVLSALCQRYVLPSGVQSVNIPRFTTGTKAGVTRDLAVSASRDITDAADSSPAVTIAGHVDVPMQMLDQSPQDASFDLVVFRDLQADYDSVLEAQIMSGAGGSGPTGELTGLLMVPSTGTITYTDASPTPLELTPSLGQAFGYVADNRKLRPTAWIMRGGRWAWMTTGGDLQNIPVSLDVDESLVPAGGPQPVGSLVGRVPVYTSESLPATLGAGGNQDVVIACCPADTIVWESAPRLNIFDEVLSGTMGARISLHTYAAALTGRYPTGTAVIGGSGLVVQSNE